MVNEQPMLTKLIDCLEAVSDIALKQRTLAQKAAVDNDISQDLLTLNKQRDHLQQEIGKIIIALPGQRENPGLSRDNPEGQKINGLVALIEENDQQTRLLMGKNLDRLRSKIQTVSTNKKALKAYSPQIKTNPWFFDNKR